MTYTLDSELPFLYGKFVPVVPHPTESEELDKIIRDFGGSNTHLASKEKGALAAQFVSNCHSASGRNAIVTSVEKLKKGWEDTKNIQQIKNHFVFDSSPPSGLIQTFSMMNTSVIIIRKTNVGINY